MTPVLLTPPELRAPWLSPRLTRQVQLIVGLLVLAAGSGLLLHPYAAETAFARNAYRGADAVSLLLGVPLLVLGLRAAARESVRGRLLLLGGLGYTTYQYGYAFAYGWTRLFPAYLLLLSLSAFTLAELLIRLDPVGVAARFDAATPWRGAARFLLVIGVGLGAMETLQVVAALVTGDPPQIVEDTGHPTSPVHLLDLGAVVPLLLLSSYWVRQHRPWGLVLAAVLLVKGTTVGLGLLAANAFALSAGTTTDGPLNVLWVLIAVGSAWQLAALLSHVLPTAA